MPVSPICIIFKSKFLYEWKKYILNFCKNSKFRKYFLLKKNIGPDLIIYLLQILNHKKINLAKQFIDKFNEMLDNPIDYDTSELAKNMKWQERIEKWFDGWKNVFELKGMNETESLLKIRDFIKSKSFVTKFDILEYMGWGVRIKFTLRLHYAF